MIASEIIMERKLKPHDEEREDPDDDLYEIDGEKFEWLEGLKTLYEAMQCRQFKTFEELEACANSEYPAIFRLAVHVSNLVRSEAEKEGREIEPDELYETIEAEMERRKHEFPGSVVREALGKRMLQELTEYRNRQS